MRPLLALAVLVLAGCTSGGHAHDGMQAIVGIRNVGESEAGFAFEIRGPVGTGPMSYQVRVEAGKTLERMVNITNEGPHQLILRWGAGRTTDAWDSTECPQYHVVFTIHPNETEERASERTRECH